MRYTFLVLIFITNGMVAESWLVTMWNWLLKTAKVYTPKAEVYTPEVEGAPTIVYNASYKPNPQWNNFFRIGDMVSINGVG